MAVPVLFIYTLVVPCRLSSTYTLRVSGMSRHAIELTANGDHGNMDRVVSHADKVSRLGYAESWYRLLEEGILGSHAPGLL